MSRRTIGHSNGYNMSSNTNRPFDNSSDSVDDEFRDRFLEDSYDNQPQPSQHTQFSSPGEMMSQNPMHFLANAPINPPNTSTQYQWSNTLPIQFPAQGHIPSDMSAYPAHGNYNPLPYDNQVIQGHAGAAQHYSGTGNLPHTISSRSSTPNPSNMHRSSRSVDNPAASSLNLLACPLCSAPFNRQDRLEDHMNIHNGSKPYACEGGCGINSCNMTFATRDARSAHGRRDKVVCEKCGHLLSKKNFARHASTHCGALLNS